MVKKILLLTMCLLGLSAYGQKKFYSPVKFFKGFYVGQNGTLIDSITVSNDTTINFYSGGIEVFPIGTGSGSGDMTTAVYDPQGILGDAFDRSNMTGSQTTSTLSDFETAVASNTAVNLNTGFRINPSGVITAGTNLSWVGNTLNATGGAATDSSFIYIEVIDSLKFRDYTFTEVDTSNSLTGLDTLGATVFRLDGVALLGVDSSNSITGVDSVKAEFLFPNQTPHAIGGFQDSVIIIDITASNTWTWVTNDNNNAFTALHGYGWSIQNDTAYNDIRSADYRGVITVEFSAQNGDEVQFRVLNATTGQPVSLHIGESGRGTTLYSSVTIPLYDASTVGDGYITQVRNINDNADVIVRGVVFEIQYLHD